MLPPKRVHLSAGRRGAEAHRGDLVAALGQRQRDAGVEHVAGRQRIDRIDLEHRHACAPRRRRCSAPRPARR